MTNNTNRLGEMLVSQMKRTSAAAVRTTMELGTIGSNLSLTTDGLKGQIPKGEYMVNLMLTGSSYNTDSDTHAHDGGGSYTHSHALPACFRSLRAGDRVLVAWCSGEPVVVAIVVGS